MSTNEGKITFEAQKDNERQAHSVEPSKSRGMKRKLDISNNSVTSKRQNHMETQNDDEISFSLKQIWVNVIKT